MTLERQNQTGYLVIAVVGAMISAFGVSLAAGKVPGFGPGGPFEWLGPILLAGITVGVPIIGTYVAAIRPRLGSASLAADVDRRRAEGITTRELVVATKDEVVEAVLSAPPPAPLPDRLVREAGLLRAEGVEDADLKIVPASRLEFLEVQARARRRQARGTDALGSGPTP